jgi:hypothetical protein
MTHRGLACQAGAGGDATGPKMNEPERVALGLEVHGVQPLSACRSAR